MLVVGVMNDQKKVKFPEKSVAKDKGEKKSTPTKPAKSPTYPMPAMSSTDIKIEALDQKWLL